MNIPQAKLPIGTKVKYNTSALIRLPHSSLIRYKDRVGSISGYWGQETNGTPPPKIDFDRKGRYAAERFIHTQWAHLEIEPSDQPDI